MRTSHDHPSLTRFLWAACGALVLMYIVLAALGAFEPDEVVALTAAAVALAALWLAHEWRQQFRRER
jgi:Flp pilus assembly protein TadB